MSKIYNFLDAESAIISIKNTVNYCDGLKCNVVTPAFLFNHPVFYVLRHCA